ncbi:hypothetical protein CAPTEDRAFT_206224 [Capitella teleta]|uniref:Uncharacterized protein n=1 Tax=Capitella teleta TaxID=283909 RepID=R7T5A9_CAPTE|nr:hypothetical protein CAPTEDRAFT_206224 [Capitella teleta]|eukprot:ELT88509.1 hypothetical protein CAPTEDRAFT_206224 [Capitella teleta]
MTVGTESYITAKDKATILNQTFIAKSRASSRPRFPSLKKRTDSTLADILFNEYRVKKILQDLNINKASDEEGQVDVIYLDFSKAFDSVSHSLLLFKLEHFYGISGSLLDWFKDYLSNRVQRVVVEAVITIEIQYPNKFWFRHMINPDTSTFVSRTPTLAAESSHPRDPSVPQRGTSESISLPGDL